MEEDREVMVVDGGSLSIKNFKWFYDIFFVFKIGFYENFYTFLEGFRRLNDITFRRIQDHSCLHCIFEPSLNMNFCTITYFEHPHYDLLLILMLQRKLMEEDGS